MHLPLDLVVLCFGCKLTNDMWRKALELGRLDTRGLLELRAKWDRYPSLKNDTVALPQRTRNKDPRGIQKKWAILVGGSFRILGGVFFSTYFLECSSLPGEGFHYQQEFGHICWWERLDVRFLVRPQQSSLERFGNVAKTLAKNSRNADDFWFGFIFHWHALWITWHVRPYPGSGVEEETMNFVLKRRPDVAWSEKDGQNRQPLWR